MEVKKPKSWLKSVSAFANGIGGTLFFGIDNDRDIIGLADALDSAEYSGSLIILLNEGIGFVKRNMKVLWKKTANSRIEMPDYCVC